MSICRGCGMVLGRDCFNEQDCMWISESMQQMYEQEQCSQAENQDVNALQNRISQLEQELAEAKKLISVVDDLVTAKGRYHTEQRYRKMVAALDDYKAIAAGLPPF